MKAATKTMQVDIHETQGVTVVEPREGRLDAEVARDLRAALLGAIEDGARRLIIDLQAVEFIDSSGLGALVSALKRLKQLDPGGDIRLARVQPPVLAVLEIIRLHRVFPPFPSVDEAMRGFQAVV